jgi:hypothetical protein
MYVGEVYSQIEQKTFTMYADTVDRAAAWRAMVKIRAQNGNLGAVQVSENALPGGRLTLIA